MKNLKKCIVENCIPTPSSCVEWNGGDIEALGICNGNTLNNIVIEIVEKLKSLTGEEISSFDIDQLIDICNIKAPSETNLVNILSLLRDNQICLKEYIDGLTEKINTAYQEKGIKIDLKCYAQLDNLGNNLDINRQQLDQLVINQLCKSQDRIKALEGNVNDIKTELGKGPLSTSVNELSFSTCLDSTNKPTSTQVVKTAKAICDLQTAVGSPLNISQALGYTPAGWNTDFGLISGWNLTPANWAQAYGNLLIAFTDVLGRLKHIETNCCAPSCDDVKIGFSASFNEDQTGIILNFSSGAGTSIPTGWSDKGSTGTVTDIYGNVETFSLVITQGLVQDVSVTSLSLNGDLIIKIDAQMGTATEKCGKSITKTLKPVGGLYCEYKAVGTVGSTITIIYTD